MSNGGFASRAKGSFKEYMSERREKQNRPPSKGSKYFSFSLIGMCLFVGMLFWLFG